MGELTFSFWNTTSGLAFSDISLATEMHLEGQRKEKKMEGEQEGVKRLNVVGREGVEWQTKHQFLGKADEKS